MTNYISFIANIYLSTRKYKFKKKTYVRTIEVFLVSKSCS